MMIDKLEFTAKVYPDVSAVLSGLSAKTVNIGIFESMMLPSAVYAVFADQTALDFVIGSIGQLQATDLGFKIKFPYMRVDGAASAAALISILEGIEGVKILG